MACNTNLEKYIKDKLISLEIFPFSVVSTNAFGGILVAVTLITSLDFDDFLNKLDYKFLCDKSGIVLLEENRTVIFRSEASVTYLLGKLE